MTATKALTAKNILENAKYCIPWGDGSRTYILDDNSVCNVNKDEQIIEKINNVPEATGTLQTFLLDPIGNDEISDEEKNQGLCDNDKRLSKYYALSVKNQNMRLKFDKNGNEYLCGNDGKYKPMVKAVEASTAEEASTTVTKNPYESKN